MPEYEYTDIFTTRLLNTSARSQDWENKHAEKKGSGLFGLAENAHTLMTGPFVAPQKVQ